MQEKVKKPKKNEADSHPPILDPSLSRVEKELEGIRIYFQLFNEQRYHECHDVMEEIWLETPDPERKFFQGLLQCAVSLHHYGNNNLHGTRILYHEGKRKLKPFLPAYLGVDLIAYLDRVKGMLPVSIVQEDNLPPL